MTARGRANETKNNQGGFMFPITDTFIPQVLAVEKDFLLVYKPPRMHSAREKNSSHAETILDWCSKKFPEITGFPGRKAGEGGLLHRLDYETQGIMLLARNATGMETLLEQQREGKILKEYSALAAKSETILPGFPKKPFSSTTFENLNAQATSQISSPQSPILVQSAFRAYGLGRKTVRPVLSDINDKAGKDENEAQKEIYTTEILESCLFSAKGLLSFRLRIWKGFRHQIRSHLAWLGSPILNDSLYGGASCGEGLLALRACSISFNDLSSGEERVYSISPFSREG